VDPGPEPEATAKPSRKVVKADPRAAQARKQQRVSRPEPAGQASEIAAPEEGSRPVWPFVLVGALVLIVGVSLAGWYVARHSA
jgi:hypothetical protein